MIYIINMTLTALMTVLAVLILCATVLSRFQHEIPRIFGYTFHIVVSPSMEPEINVGDFAVARADTVDNAKVGDYVVFITPDPSLRGITILHAVTEVGYDGQGKYLVTTGIKEGAAPDGYPVREIIGIYRWKSAFLGKLILFFSSGKNLIFSVVVFAALTLAVKYSFRMVKEIQKIKEKKDVKREEKP